MILYLWITINPVNLYASPKRLSDTNQPMYLISLPTTGSISLNPLAGGKASVGGVYS